MSLLCDCLTGLPTERIIAISLHHEHPVPLAARPSPYSAADRQSPPGSLAFPDRQAAPPGVALRSWSSCARTIPCSKICIPRRTGQDPDRSNCYRSTSSFDLSLMSRLLVDDEPENLPRTGYIGNRGRVDALFAAFANYFERKSEFHSRSKEGGKISTRPCRAAAN